MHKPYMVVAKVVDLLIEPAVYAAGMDLYEDDWHLRITHLFASDGRDVCPMTWSPLLESFVDLIWRGTQKAADQVVNAVAAARGEAGDHLVGAFLGLVPLDARVLLGWYERAEGEPSRDALDPALAATHEQAVWWSEKLGPFKLVYDESKLVGGGANGCSISSIRRLPPHTRSRDHILPAR